MEKETVSNDSVHKIAEKLYQEGVEKGQKESEQIIQSAEQKARQIISDAEKKAEEIIRHAEDKGAHVKEHIETEITIAFREIMHDFHHKITNIIIYEGVEKKIKSTLSDHEIMKELLKTLFEKWEIQNPEVEGLEVLLPQDMQEKLKSWVEEEMSELLNKGVRIKFSPVIKGGFQITPEGASYKIDLSEDGFRELFKQYLKPHTRDLLFNA